MNRVLVVDDNRDLGELTSEILKERGFRVNIAFDGVSALAKIKQEPYDLIILDEVNVALSLHLISLEELLDILRNLPQDLDIILTGRGAPKKLIQVADLVTEFREIKHPFQKGVFAKIGLEY